MELMDSSEPLPFVASSEEFLHYTCSECKLLLWMLCLDAVCRLVSEGTTDVCERTQLQPSVEGDVNDHVPACKLYLFINLWYLCVVSVMTSSRCYMKHFNMRVPSSTLNHIELNDSQQQPKRELMPSSVLIHIQSAQAMKLIKTRQQTADLQCVA